MYDFESLRVEYDRTYGTAPVELDPQKLDIGHAADQLLQSGIAALFDDLDGFGTAAHAAPPVFGCSTVKAPVAVATGRLVSSSVAVARTKATDRVT